MPPPPPMNTLFFPSDDQNQTLSSCFTKYENKVIKSYYPTSVSNTDTLEECMKACEDTDERFQECVGFQYSANRGGSCWIFFDRAAFQYIYDENGTDFYNKTDCLPSEYNNKTQYTRLYINNLCKFISFGLVNVWRTIALAPASLLLSSSVDKNFSIHTN